MRTVTYKLEDLITKVIHIGKVAENDATRVQIDAGSVFADYPAAVPAMSMISPDGTAFPVSVERSGDLVLWDVKDSALAAEGPGEIQFTFTDGTTVVKSAVGAVQICRSIVADGEAPDPIQDWLDDAEETLAKIDAAIPAGGTTGQVLAKASGTDYDTEWVDQTGGGGGGTSDYTQLTNKPQIGGVTLTGNKSLHDLGAAAESDIPDVSGFYTKPAGGIPASDIADGVIPDVSGFYTKPANGIPAEDIASGVIPDPTSIIDDTAGDGDTNKVWSADKTADLMSAITSYDNIHKAIISVLQHVAFLDNSGKDEYDALYDLVYPTVAPASITAVYSGTIPIYESDDLSILANDLVVTATYEDETSEVITSGYELSGSLTRGTSTITVSYKGKTDTFNVVVYGFSFVKHYTNGITSNVVRVKENNARLICDGTTGNIPFKFEDGTSSGFYPVPIRTGATSITCDVDATAARLTIGIFFFDTSVNDFKRTYGSDWSNVETFDLTSYNNGTYYVAFNLACTNLTSDTASLDTSTWSVSVN